MTTTAPSNFATLLQTDLQAAENWVVNFFATLKTDVAILEQDIIYLGQFLQAHGTQIATGVTGVLTAVAAAGIGIPAPILAAASALTAASNVVNQAVAAQQASAASGAGVGTQTAILLGSAYQNLKTASSNLAQAQATVTAPAPAAS